MNTATTRTELVPTYCYQCVGGPDLLTVKVVDGVATEIEPNAAGRGIHPGDGQPGVNQHVIPQNHLGD